MGTKKPKWEFDTYLQQWTLNVGGAVLSVEEHDDSEGDYTIAFCDEHAEIAMGTIETAKQQAIEFAKERMVEIVNALKKITE